MTTASPTPDPEAPFTARNALETTLLQAQAGAVPPSRLFEALVAAQVFVLANQALAADGRWGEDMALLLLNSQAGAPVMAVFTSPERADGWAQRAPAFQHGLLMEFRWLLQWIAPDLGLVLNPGGAVALELTPGMLQKLKASLAAAKPG